MTKCESLLSNESNLFALLLYTFRALKPFLIYVCMYYRYCINHISNILRKRLWALLGCEVLYPWKYHLLVRFYINQVLSRFLHGQDKCVKYVNSFKTIINHAIFYVLAKVAYVRIDWYDSPSVLFCCFFFLILPGPHLLTSSKGCHRIP